MSIVRPSAPHPHPTHWKDISKRSLQRDGYACRLCGEREGLHQHHRTYERFGEERVGDLTTLCAQCHKVFHKYLFLRRSQ
jgi:5-methylcytosine-specific restriction endonuclease McrA